MGFGLAMVMFSVSALGSDVEVGSQSVSEWGSPTSVSSPDTVKIDLLRTEPGGNRIYIQAKLPDGALGLFLVDTGAAISVLTQETADRLDLNVEQDIGYVEGLGGRAPFHHSVLESLAIGDAIVSNIDLAVGVRGLPTRAGFATIDGILGNNVLGLFTVEIDYPADTILFHKPDTYEMSRDSSPMVFDGEHIFSPLVVTPGGKDTLPFEVLLQIDTGAGELLVSGRLSETQQLPFTEGLEAIYGIGASEIMPPSQFFVPTRRVPLEYGLLGGRQIKLKDQSARWINFDPAVRQGPALLSALGGHDLLSRHVATFDYRQGLFSLTKSKRQEAKNDIHQVLLSDDLRLFPDDPTRSKFRAQMHAALDGQDPETPAGDHLNEARALLIQYLTLDDTDDRVEATVLLSRLHRYNGDLDSAVEVMSTLSAKELLVHGELISGVNALLLNDKPNRALSLVEEAAPFAGSGVSPAFERSAIAVCYADIALYNLNYELAGTSLMEAAEYLQNPDAHLLRRARVAHRGGDIAGASAHVRRLVELYPSEGTFLWFHTILSRGFEEQTTLRRDMVHAVARLHPDSLPTDFEMAAYRKLGDDDRVSELLKSGTDQYCDTMTRRSSRQNCRAWFHALAGKKLGYALKNIDKALASEGPRADFLDTKAMVHFERGEYTEAAAASHQAALMAPDDIYMLWQFELLDSIQESRGD